MGEKKLLEMLGNMPGHKLNAAVSTRILNGIRDEEIRIRDRKRRNVKLGWALCGGVCLIAVLLYAVGILPNWDYDRMSSESGGKVKDTAPAQVSPTPVHDNSVQVTPEVTPAQEKSSDFRFMYVKMSDAKSGWSSAEKSVFHTEDGGVTWNDVTPKGNTASGIFNTYFINSSRAWIVLSSDEMNPVFYYTTDSGRSWKKIKSPVQGFGADIQFMDDKTGWALIHKDVAMHHEDVNLLNTTDGGITWSVVSGSNPQGDKPGAIPFAGTKTGFCFSDKLHGFITGDIPVEGSIYLYATSDGGRSWKQKNITIPAAYSKDGFYSMPPVFLNEKEGILPVRASSGKMLFFFTKDGGSSWNIRKAVSLKDGNVKYSILDMNNIVVCDGTNIYTTKDGCMSWSTTLSGISLEDASAINFISPYSAFLAKDDKLFRTTDGGTTWNKVEYNLVK